MSFLEIFLTALSLSLDAVAVSVAGASLHHLRIQQALKLALFFGGFQLVMPLIGWAIGSNFKEYFLNYGNIVGFLALFTLGSKMSYEAIKEPTKEKEGNKKNITDTKVLFILAITTSIDALVIGITFNFIPVNIPIAVTTIGLTTFVLCLAAVYLGTKGRHLMGSKMELVGALILITLSFKILLFP